MDKTTDVLLSSVANYDIIIFITWTLCIFNKTKIREFGVREFWKQKFGTFIEEYLNYDTHHLGLAGEGKHLQYVELHHLVGGAQLQRDVVQITPV